MVFAVAAALTAAAESGSVFNRLYNPGFVQVEYFGFLRRDPDDPPDSDISGYDFGLGKMDLFTLPGEDARVEHDAFERIKRTEMVRAFIVSQEYRQRFGQVHGLEMAHRPNPLLGFCHPPV